MCVCMWGGFQEAFTENITSLLFLPLPYAFRHVKPEKTQHDRKVLLILQPVCVREKIRSGIVQWMRCFICAL